MPDIKTIQIGEQIKYYRHLKNMSQEALTLSAGITPAFVGHIERGLKSPTVNTLQKITSALDISLVDLFTPIEAESVPPSRIRSLDTERLLFSLAELSDEEFSLLTQIITNIVKFKKDSRV